MNRILPLSLLLALPLTLLSQEKPTAQAEPARWVAPYLDNQVIAVLHVDLTRIDVERALATLRKAGLAPKELEEMGKGLKQLLTGITGAGLKQGVAVFSLADLPDSPPLFVLPLEKGNDGKLLQTLLGAMPMADSIRFEKRETALIGGSPKAMARLKELKPAERPELAQGFQRLGDSAFRLIVAPGKDFRQAFEELAPTLPRELGGGPSSILSRGLQWLALGVQLPPDASLRLVLQGSDETTARALQSFTVRVLDTLIRDREAREAIPDLEKILADSRPRLVSDRVELVYSEDVLLKVAGRVAGALADTRVRIQGTNNLKQIGIAFHNYHDSFGALPAVANHDKQGKPLLSWRVHLLPFLEADNLYKQFRFDEPWDSEHNKKLIPRMPRIYASMASPKLAAEGKTTYVVPTGPMSAFAGKKGLKLTQVTDGTSNTLLAVDVEEDHAVIWTKPDDWQFDPKAPAKGLRKHGGKKYMMLFMDGSLRFIDAKVDPKTIQALVTPSGNEIIPELP